LGVIFTEDKLRRTEINAFDQALEVIPMEYGLELSNPC
jgi:hypothetical protein